MSARHVARRPIVGGNWKLHTTRDEALALLDALVARLDGLAAVDVVICPPAPWLGDAARVLAGTSLRVGAQHTSWEARGAFTGEVSAALLAGTAQYAIVGHSERRQIFGQTDDETRRTLRAVIDAGLVPILAVGEQLTEREAGATETVLRRQLERALDGLDALPPGSTLAYEPVWAIGTGRNATPDLAQQACAFLRRVVRERLGDGAAEAVRVQYGGSVTPENVAALAAQPDIDGALVGGASLDADRFAAICRAVADARR